MFKIIYLLLFSRETIIYEKHCINPQNSNVCMLKHNILLKIFFGKKNDEMLLKKCVTNKTKVIHLIIKIKQIVSFTNFQFISSLYRLNYENHINIQY